MSASRPGTSPPRHIETLSDTTVRRILASLNETDHMQGFLTSEQRARLDHYQREYDRRKRLNRKLGAMP